jgi:type 1 fimbriae regulatory protein FimB
MSGLRLVASNRLPVSQPQPSPSYDEVLVRSMMEANRRLEMEKKARRKAKTKQAKKEKPIVSLTEDELLRVFAAAQQRRMRDLVLLVLMYRHGLRDSEAIRLRRRDLEGGILRVQRGKGSKYTEQPLHGHPHPLLDVARLAAAWLADLGTRGMKGTAKPGSRYAQRILLSARIVKSFTASDELLFPVTRQRVWQIYREYAQAAGLHREKCHPHCLKHTITMHLLDEGVPVHEVTDWLGWSSMRTIEHYTRSRKEKVHGDVDRALRRKAGLQPAMQPSLFPAS